MNLKHRFSRPRGVTLIELVVVIAVAGILASVASPTVFRAIRRERERTMVNAMANHLREARNQAMARGEALRIYALYDLNGGSPTTAKLRTYRTSMQLPDGTWELGARTCVSDTEDITTDDCPEGSVCMEDRCWGRPARSCREMSPTYGSGTSFTSGSVHYEMVDDFDFDRFEGTDIGLRVSYSTNSAYVFCFGPDGRAEGMTGGFLQPFSPGVYSCTNEGFNLWVGDKDPTKSYSQVLSKMQCDSPPEDYEEVHGYVIRVMNNGEISLRSPAQ